MSVLPAGCTLRHPLADDMPAAQAVLDAAESADAGEPRRHDVRLVEQVRDPTFDLDHNVWVVDGPDATLVAVAWVWPQIASGEVTADLYVRPEARGRGVEAALLETIEGRAAELAAAGSAARPASAADAQPARLIVWNQVDDRVRRRLLDERGFTPTRQYFEMRIDLTAPYEAPPAPAGFALRAIRLPDDERAVWRADREAFAEHHLFAERDFEVWRLHHVESDAFDADSSLLAWEGDELAGFELAFVEGDEVAIGDLAVRKPWRGRGLGLALLRAAFAALVARGHRVVRLTVDAQNVTGALRVYERAGMRVERRFDCLEKPLEDRS